MKIEHSQKLGRSIRSEALSELGTPTWDGVKAAIREGRPGDALAGIDYACFEAKAMHDSAVSLVNDALTRLAEVAGEQQVYELFHRRYEPLMRGWLEATPGVEESLQRTIEFQRGHFGSTALTEEADRYVVTCDPCGSGGRLRRTKTVARAKERHDWTWNRDDVPLYCTHCTVMWEILPTDLRGYPVRINLPPEKDSDPCVHLYYKDPAAIPQEYFDRIGRARGGAAAAPPQPVPAPGNKSSPDER